MPPGGPESLNVRIAQRLTDTLGPQNYQRRLQGKADFHVDGNELVVQLANPFVMQWLQSRHNRLLNEIAGEVVGPQAQVVFRTAESSLTAATESDEDAARSASIPRMPAVNHSAKPPVSAASARRRHAELADFVVGDSNQLAFAAAMQVAERPGEQLNPLVVHGNVGIGKTHLLEGIVQAVRSRFPERQTLLVTAENFLNFFTEAMKAKTMPSFRQRFRKVDVLLVDDIDFLGGKRAICEEFLNTVKKLAAEGCQMVFTSEQHPKLLKGMGDDVISRLMAGIVCRIEPPELATRRALVARFAEQAGLTLNEEIQEHIAKRFTRNARELQGAVNTLYTYSLLYSEPLSLRVAKNVLAPFEGECQKIVRIVDVEQAVCGMFHVSPETLRSGDRKQTVCYARHMAIYLARRLTGAAFSEIGSHFGNRNHSTIITSNDKVKELIANDGVLQIAGARWRVEDLLESLEQQIMAS